MAYIQLTNSDRKAIIDDSDFHGLPCRKWRLFANHGTNRPKSNLYAVARIDGKVVSMHRLIMDAQPGQQVDHLDRNGLNNRRQNLRFATVQQQAQNKGAYSSSKSHLRGVYQDQSCQNRWRAEIRLNGKKIFRKSFRSAEEASMAVVKARSRLMPFAVD